MFDPNPYAAPISGSSEVAEDEFRTFYMSFWRPFLIFGLITLPAFFQISSDFNVYMFDGLYFVTVFSVWISADALFVLIVNRFFPVFVGRSGLKCFDFWARYHHVDWASIHTVKPINWLGLKYLLVYSSQLARPIWLPVFLNEPSAFRSISLDRGAESDAFLKGITESELLNQVG